MNPKLNLNEDGSFSLEHADLLSYLYFPLANTSGMKSAITPKFGGDAKIDQNHFLLQPVTNEDYHSSLMNRNMYFRINDKFTWSVTGNTPHQTLHKDTVTVKGDFLIHEVTRTNEQFEVSIESFVPTNQTYQELHRITFHNNGKESLMIKPVIGIPLYARSADNIRDHRHVTSLLNRGVIYQNGLINQPTFSFDERGHNLNQTNYGVFVSNNNKLEVINYWPILEEFIGEGESLLDPLVVKSNQQSTHQVTDVVSGYELLGGFEFERVVLQPKETTSFIISIMADKSRENIIQNAKSINDDEFDSLLKKTKEYWKKELSSLQFSFPDKQLNGWLKWVTLQPILRRIYGCSFLPHHDYGKGGRGWRDLWQDSLALILMDPNEVRNMLMNNFQGVRIDGSNATIIGDAPGEFKADRNNIVRVWMDHGAWPFITTLLYVNKSGDWKFLLESQRYFQDQFTHYTKQVSESLNNNYHLLQTKEKREYQGSILEHLIIQNLIPFYNVGEHGNIRIEGADWNDALDMAEEKGESVAFTSLYANNLIEIGEVLLKLYDLGVKEISLLEELDILFTKIDFKQPQEKQKLLQQYFESVSKPISGKQKHYDTKKLSLEFILRGGSLQNHIKNNEWMETENGAWFNGYYDGDGNRLENTDEAKMTLTGQVFAIYSGTATYDQICNITYYADEYLYKKEIGGYCLNTDFKELKMNMGRLFGFAYGHKENGAMFSHMAVMYANALYRRGYVKSGNKVLQTIYDHSTNVVRSKIYPGLPEYFDPKGRGLYTYLTGSASWLILTEVTEVFGIQGYFGDLVLQPKLLSTQFNKVDKASIKTIINNQLMEVIYNNPKRLPYGDYWIKEVKIDKKPVRFEPYKNGIIIKAPVKGKLIEVLLDYMY